MMRVLMIAVIALAAPIVVAATLLGSKSPSLELSVAAMPALQELHRMAGVEQLPEQEIDDQALMYPAVEKRSRIDPR